jgi:hypothetical protein
VSARGHTRLILRRRIDAWYSCFVGGSDSVGKMMLLFANYWVVKYCNKYRNIVWSFLILNERYFKSRHKKLGSCETNGTIKISNYGDTNRTKVISKHSFFKSYFLWSSKPNRSHHRNPPLGIFQAISFLQNFESVPPVYAWDFEAIYFLWLYPTQETHMKPTWVLLLH